MSVVTKGQAEDIFNRWLAGSRTEADIAALNAMADQSPDGSVCLKSGYQEACAAGLLLKRKNYANKIVDYCESVYRLHGGKNLPDEFGKRGCLCANPESSAEMRKICDILLGAPVIDEIYNKTYGKKIVAIQQTPTTVTAVPVPPPVQITTPVTAPSLTPLAKTPQNDIIIIGGKTFNKTYFMIFVCMIVLVIIFTIIYNTGNALNEV